MVDFCIAKGVRVRGHNLVWGRYLSEGFVADIEARLAGAADRREAMREILRAHISAVMTHFRGRVHEWDVLNEPLKIFQPELDDTLWHRTLGDDYIGEIFKMAHEVDPQAILYLNEQLDDYSNAHAERLLQLLGELVRAKVPINGLGLESHVVIRKPRPEALKNFLRRVVAMGLTFELTELDVRLRAFGEAKNPYEAQGDYYGEIIRTAVSFPECRGITFWGMTDRNNWMDSMFPIKYLKPNEPDLFDLNGIRKPAYWAAARALRDRPPSASGNNPTDSVPGRAL
ncbi:MAG TPA: endo-1,4-beta-xylanase [Opitutaceae bacterium]